MKREKGRTVRDLFDDKEKRFLVIALEPGNFGLYDAEIDEIIMEEKINSVLSNYDAVQVIKMSTNFLKKIEELEKGE